MKFFSNDKRPESVTTFWPVFISSFHTTFIYSSVILTTVLLNLHFGINSLLFSGCHYYGKLLNWVYYAAQIMYADNYNGINFQSFPFTQI